MAKSENNANVSRRLRSRLMTLGRRMLWLAIFIIFVPLVRATATSEYELKAAFLLNFARFIQWPENVPPVNQPIVIGVLGTDPFGSSLDSIVAGETVNGRVLTVKRLERNDPISDCQILYVCRSEISHLSNLLERVKGQAILTVSDIDRFVYMGGMIGLTMDRGKVRVQINVDVAKNGQLAISAKLLRLSLVVRDRQSMLHPGWRNLYFCYDGKMAELIRINAGTLDTMCFVESEQFHIQSIN